MRLSRSHPGKGARAHIARSTGRPAKKARNGVGKARALLERLTVGETADQLRLTAKQVGVLDRIASGNPPRNANAIMRALEAKLLYSQPKPKQATVIEHSGPDGAPIQHEVREIKVTFVEPKPDSPASGS